MLDDFSTAYIAKYKIAGEAKIVHQQVAQSLKMNIADIESRHASLRRMPKPVVQAHKSSADFSRSGSSVLDVAGWSQ